MKYTEAKDTVLQELQTVFANVKEEEVLALTAAICEAESVFVVGVGRQDKHHLISALDGEFPIGIADRSALDNGFQAYNVLHAVVVQAALINESVVVHRRFPSFGNRTRIVAQREVLLATL